MVYLLTALSFVGFLIALIATHEWGHYVAGRLVKVPKSRMRVNLEARPPHVALLSESGEWLSPDHKLYNKAFLQYSSTKRSAWVFIAGGMAQEFIVTAIGVTTFLLLGWSSAAVALIAASLLIGLAYLFGDIVLSIKSKKPYGDHAAMYALFAGATTLYVVVLLAAKVALLLWVISAL